MGCTIKYSYPDQKSKYSAVRRQSWWPISKTYLTRYLAEKSVRQLTEVVNTKQITRKPDNVIVVLQTGISSLEQFLLQGQKSKVKIPSECQDCQGKLWKHGTYERTCRTLFVFVFVVIQRALCKECGKTVSCLYEFLTPYKQYDESVRSRYVEKYLEPGATYRDAAWGDEDGDRADAEASVSRAYRAVKEAGESAELMVQQIQQECVEAGMPIPEMEREETQQELYARTDRKARQLGLLILAMWLARLVSGECRPSWLMLKVYMSCGYTLCNLGFRLSGPQSLKQALF